MSSGYMMAHVAAAALLNECKVLAHPASVDSVPTSGGKEDHVSMGMNAALKMRQIVENVEQVLAIELLCAAQGLDYRKPLKPGKQIRAGTRRDSQDRSPSRSGPASRNRYQSTGAGYSRQVCSTHSPTNRNPRTQ